MYDAFDYVRKNGISLKDKYPRQYTPTERPCVYNEQSMASFYNLGQIESDFNSNDILKQLLQNGPVSVAMQATFPILRNKQGVVS